jgi:hypothetical protein
MGVVLFLVRTERVRARSIGWGYRCSPVFMAGERWPLTGGIWLLRLELVDDELDGVGDTSGTSSP